MADTSELDGQITRATATALTATTGLQPTRAAFLAAVDRWAPEDARAVIDKTVELQPAVVKGMTDAAFAELTRETDQAVADAAARIRKELDAVPVWIPPVPERPTQEALAAAASVLNRDRSQAFELPGGVAAALNRIFKVAHDAIKRFGFPELRDAVSGSAHAPLINFPDELMNAWFAYRRDLVAVCEAWATVGSLEAKRTQIVAADRWANRHSRPNG